jgi:hypothetical protein
MLERSALIANDEPPSSAHLMTILLTTQDFKFILA